jgi:hypothetical protein
MTLTSDPTPPIDRADDEAGMVDYLLLGELAAATEVHFAEPVLIGDPSGHSVAYDLAAAGEIRGRGWVAQLYCGAHVNAIGRFRHGLEYHPERPGRPLAGRARATVVYGDRRRRELRGGEAQRLAVHHLPAITAALRAHDNPDSQVLATLLSRRYGWAPRRWHHETLRAVDRLGASG